MAITENTLVGEILDKPGAKAVLEKYAGQAIPDASLQMAKQFPLKLVTSNMSMSSEKLAELVNELNEL